MIKKFKPYCLIVDKLPQQEVNNFHNIYVYHTKNNNIDLYRKIQDDINNLENEIKVLEIYIRNQAQAKSDLIQDISLSIILLNNCLNLEKKKDIKFLDKKIKQLEIKLKSVNQQLERDYELYLFKKQTLDYNREELNSMKQAYLTTDEQIQLIIDEMAIINEYKEKFEQSLFNIVANITKLNYKNGDKEFSQLIHISENVFPYDEKKYESINSFIDKINNLINKYIKGE